MKKPEVSEQLILTDDQLWSNPLNVENPTENDGATGDQVEEYIKTKLSRAFTGIKQNGSEVIFTTDEGKESKVKMTTGTTKYLYQFEISDFKLNTCIAEESPTELETEINSISSASIDYNLSMWKAFIPDDAAETPDFEVAEGTSYITVGILNNSNATSLEGALYRERYIISTSKETLTLDITNLLKQVAASTSKYYIACQIDNDESKSLYFVTSGGVKYSIKVAEYTLLFSSTYLYLNQTRIPLTDLSGNYIQYAIANLADNLESVNYIESPINNGTFTLDFSENLGTTLEAQVIALTCRTVKKLGNDVIFYSPWVSRNIIYLPEEATQGIATIYEIAETLQDCNNNSLFKVITTDKRTGNVEVLLYKNEIPESEEEISEYTPYKQIQLELTNDKTSSILTRSLYLEGETASSMQLGFYIKNNGEFLLFKKFAPINRAYVALSIPLQNLFTVNINSNNIKYNEFGEYYHEKTRKVLDFSQIDYNSLFTDEVINSIDDTDGIQFENLVFFKASPSSGKIFKNDGLPLKTMTGVDLFSELNEEFSLEFMFNSENISDISKPLFNIGNFRIYPNLLRLLENDIKPEEDDVDNVYYTSLADYQKEQITHVIITYKKDYIPESYDYKIFYLVGDDFNFTTEDNGDVKKDAYDCLKIYINGTINRVIELNSSLLGKSNFQIDSTNALTYLYLFRTYDSCLTYNLVKKNRTSAFFNYLDKESYVLNNDITFTAAECGEAYSDLVGLISLAKCLGLRPLSGSLENRPWKKKNVFVEVIDDREDIALDFPENLRSKVKPLKLPLNYCNKDTEYPLAALLIKYYDAQSGYNNMYSGRIFPKKLWNDEGLIEYHKAQGSSAKKYLSAYNDQYSKFYFVSEKERLDPSLNVYYNKVVKTDSLNKEHLEESDYVDGTKTTTSATSTIKVWDSSKEKEVEVTVNNTQVFKGENPVKTENKLEYYQLPGEDIHIAKLVGKVNMASSLQSHKLSACNLYNDAYKSIHNSTSKTRLAVKEIPFLFFYVKLSDIVSLPGKENVRITNVTWDDIDYNKAKFYGFITWGSAKGDLETFGLDKKKSVFLEGADNNNASTNFKVPWAAQQMWDPEALNQEHYKTIENVSGKIENIDYVKEGETYYELEKTLDKEDVKTEPTDGYEFVKEGEYQKVVYKKIVNYIGFDYYDDYGTDNTTLIPLHYKQNKGCDANFVPDYLTGLYLYDETFKYKFRLPEEVNDKSTLFSPDSWDMTQGFDDTYKCNRLTDVGKAAVRKFAQMYNLIYLTDAANLVQTKEENLTSWDTSRKYIWIGQSTTKTVESQLLRGDTKTYLIRLVKGNIYRYDPIWFLWVDAGLYPEKMVDKLISTWQELSITTLGTTILKIAENSTSFNSNEQKIRHTFDGVSLQLSPQDCTTIGSSQTDSAAITNKIKILGEVFKLVLNLFINIDTVIYHQAMMRFLLGTDNRAKNTYWKFTTSDAKIELFLDDLDTILKTDNNGQQTKNYNLLEPPFNLRTKNRWGDLLSGFFTNVDLLFAQEINDELVKILNFVNNNNRIDTFLDINRYYPSIAYNHTSEIYYEVPNMILRSSAKQLSTNFAKKLQSFDPEKKIWDEKYALNNSVGNPVSLSHGSCLEAEQEFFNTRTLFLGSMVGSDIAKKDSLQISFNTGEGASEEIKVKIKASYNVDYYPSLFNNYFRHELYKEEKDPEYNYYRPLDSFENLISNDVVIKGLTVGNVSNPIELYASINGKDVVTAGANYIYNKSTYKTLEFNEGCDIITSFDFPNVEHFIINSNRLSKPKYGAGGLVFNVGTQLKSAKNIELYDTIISGTRVSLYNCNALEEFIWNFSSDYVAPLGVTNTSTVILPKSLNLRKLELNSYITNVSVGLYNKLADNLDNLNISNCNFTKLTIDGRNKPELLNAFLEKFNPSAEDSSLEILNIPEEGITLSPLIIAKILSCNNLILLGSKKINVSGEVGWNLRFQMLNKFAENVDNIFYYDKLLVESLNEDSNKISLKENGIPVYNIIGYNGKKEANKFNYSDFKYRFEGGKTSLKIGSGTVFINPDSGEITYDNVADSTEVIIEITVQGKSTLRTIVKGTPTPKKYDFVYSDGTYNSRYVTNKEIAGWIYDVVEDSNYWTVRILAAKPESGILSVWKGSPSWQAQNDAECGIYVSTDPAQQSILAGLQKIINGGQITKELINHICSAGTTKNNSANDFVLNDQNTSYTLLTSTITSGIELKGEKDLGYKLWEHILNRLKTNYKLLYGTDILMDDIEHGIIRQEPITGTYTKINSGEIISNINIDTLAFLYPLFVKAYAHSYLKNYSGILEGVHWIIPTVNDWNYIIKDIINNNSRPSGSGTNWTDTNYHEDSALAGVVDTLGDNSSDLPFITLERNNLVSSTFKEGRPLIYGMYKTTLNGVPNYTSNWSVYMYTNYTQNQSTPADLKNPISVYFACTLKILK